MSILTIKAGSATRSTGGLIPSAIGARSTAAVEGITTSGVGSLDFPGIYPNWLISGTVNHVVENFSSYSSASDIITQGRPDGGNAWTLNGAPSAYHTLHTDELPPWNPGKRLHIDYSGVNNNSRGLRLPAANWATNTNSLSDSIIIQWVWKWCGRDTFEGKITDTLASPGGRTHRLVFHEAWSNSRPGVEYMGPDSYHDYCSYDTRICYRYYQGTYPNFTPLPQFVGIIPPSDRSVSEHVFLGIDDGITVPPPNNLPSGSTLIQTALKANRGYGIDGMSLTPMKNDGTGGPGMVDDTWRVTTVRCTRSYPGYSGSFYGRFEFWYSSEALGNVKILEYIGDPGAFDEGVIGIWPSNIAWNLASMHFATGFTSGTPGAWGNVMVEGTVTSASANTLTDTTKSWTTNQWSPFTDTTPVHGGLVKYRVIRHSRPGALPSANYSATYVLGAVSTNDGTTLTAEADWYDSRITDPPMFQAGDTYRIYRDATCYVSVGGCYVSSHPRLSL